MRLEVDFLLVYATGFGQANLPAIDTVINFTKITTDAPSQTTRTQTLKNTV